MYSKIFCFIILFFECFARNSFPDYTDNDFQNECLAETNKFRNIHHAPNLNIDKQALENAKSRCAYISQYEGLSNGHAGSSLNYGENLYWGGSSSIQPCSTAIDSWYEEVKNYDYNNPGFGMNTGHFTQLVWKSTTGVGCARCGGQGSQWFETYIVCEYSPPGNYEGQFPQNVLKP